MNRQRYSYSTKGKRLRLSARKRRKSSYKTSAAQAARRISQIRSEQALPAPEQFYTNQPPGLERISQIRSEQALPAPEQFYTNQPPGLERISQIRSEQALPAPEQFHTNQPPELGSRRSVPKRKYPRQWERRRAKRINWGLVKWRCDRKKTFEGQVDICDYHVDDPERAEAKYIIEEMDVNREQLAMEPGPPDASLDEAINSISGRYIVDGQHFIRALRKLENHRFECTTSTNGYFKLKSSNIKAMVLTLCFECPECGLGRTITSDGAQYEDASLWPINDSAVWGTLAMGGGHSNMVDFLTTMGVKPMDKKTFTKKENELGKVWQRVLFDTMLQAGRKEKELALENGDIDENGTPFITVVVDGGWSHRSHGHRYTSQSGVACVIGHWTKKLLHLYIRNKYCSACQYLEKNGHSTSHEECFKNWQGSAQAMESDMLVQAFRTSLELHGLEYRCVIGDGDSSVYAKLREMVPYGLKIRKSECANHAVKNYCKALFNKKCLPQAVRKILSKQVILRLKKDARYAIYYVAETTGSAQQLREDLINGPAHVFGVHDNCKSYFCNKTVNESELSGFRLAAFNFAQECLRPLLRKADRLLNNNTSNLAENLMSLVAKFSGGKQVNHCKRGSYDNRCKAAGLDFQFGPAWTHATMKAVKGKSPASIIKRTAVQREKRSAQTRKSVVSNRKLRTQLRYANAGETGPERSNTNHYYKTTTDKSGPKDYGPLCHDLDMDDQQFADAAKIFVRMLNVDSEKRIQIELVTRGQHSNELWFMERRHRLTASNFGVICKRRPTTKSAKLVETLLYPKTFENDAVTYGTIHERDAIKAYHELFPDRILSECGLFVHPQFGFLGASPDSLVDHDGLLEVKCPKTAEFMTLEEATKVKGFCLNPEKKLKPNHNYFYQVQGQLEIADRNYCDFVVWAPKFVHVTRVDRDKEFWATNMLPKLSRFFETAILPELADPRKCRSMPLREV